MRARIVVEGLWAGLHRSPYRGFSVEFSEYRQYTSGDDLRYLDWKALARVDKELIKVYEDETNLSCLILLDTSRSMGFSSTTHSKLEYARTLAATLGYFLLQQRDVVGLARFDSAVRDYLAPRWRSGHLKRMLALLERPAEGTGTDLGRALEEAGRLCRKRSLMIILSDFLSAPEGWSRPLSQLSAAGHDLRAIQILDPAEISLDFGSAAYWEDIESSATLYVNPEAARENYQQRFRARRREVAATFAEQGIPLQSVTTDQPMDQALLHFLGRSLRPQTRSRRRRRAG